MAGWLEKLLGRGRGKRGVRGEVRPPVEKFRAASRASEPGWGAASVEAYLPMPGGAPFEMLRVYRFLRDAIPDISDAVWTWKRLCQTGFEVDIADASSEIADIRVRHR